MMPPGPDKRLLGNVGYWCVLAGIAASPLLIVLWIAPGIPRALIFVLCFVVAVLILLPFYARWHRLYQSREWERTGCCPHCGYPRRGLTVSRCPECGADFPE